MRLRGVCSLCLLVAALVLTSSTYGQEILGSTSLWNSTGAVEQTNPQEQAQREALAEAILAREEMQSGRAFDPGFRAQAKQALTSLSIQALEAQQTREGLGTNALGDSGADLVYTPITPCRIIDTRLGSGAIAANATRSFFVAGATGFAAQGGEAAGCGVPVGATSAMINFVAVNPPAPGDLRITPFGTAMPLASILNWAGGVPGLNLANGLAVKLCDPAGTTCTADIVLQADASAIDIVADVQGYFMKTAPGILRGQPLTRNFSGTLVSGYIDFIPNYVPPVNVRAFTYIRCGVPATAAGQTLGFKSAIRTPTGAAGTVIDGTAFILYPSSTGTETLFSAHNDWFDLNAGQSYDFGIHSFGTAAGFGDCAALVQLFTR